MLVPRNESYNTILSFPVTATLKALITPAMKAAYATLTIDPYGNPTTGFTGGMIAQLADESGTTVVDISDGTNPIGIFNGSLNDAVAANQADFYLLQQGLVANVKSCYDQGQTYTVGARLTVIPSGANKGKLTLATVYGGQATVARVIDPPADASNDDFMTIVTELAYA